MSDNRNSQVEGYSSTSNLHTPPTTPPRSTAKRLSTPPSTGGSRRGNRIYSDRFIPSRTTTNLEEAFDILGNKLNQSDTSPKPEVPQLPSSATNTTPYQIESQQIMNNLLRSELLGQPIMDFSPEGRFSEPGNTKTPPRRESSGANLFKYRLSQGSTTSMETNSTLGVGSGSLLDGDEREGRNSFGIDLDRDSGNSFTGLTGSPMNNRGGASYLTPTKKPVRKISKTPFKILDAPSLQDDYYLNLVDWSPNNVLAVALTSCVYLWSACTSKVHKLCDYGSSELVTSIAWALAGHQIAVGTSTGKIQIWDHVVGKMIRELQSHESRVGALAWNSSLLASGSRDRSIYLQDIRIKSLTTTPSRTSVGGGGGGGGSSGGGSNTGGGISSGTTSITPPRPLVTSLTDPLFPLTDTTASNSDDTFVFTDPLANITTSATALPTTSTSEVLRYTTGRGILLPSTTTTPIPTNGSVVNQLLAHRQEVCGLRWSFDEKLLASGGNDNKLYVWDPQGVGASSNTHPSNSWNNSTYFIRALEPLHRFEDHTAAVKAVAWSPHQQGLLASGGGTADRHIRFWNASTGQTLHKVDTGSQVCNLMWSKTVNEIVSTHGYSLNQVIVWRYPTMQKLATLSGHTLRVLYLAMSPDGQTIVTGAGDETLRFWNVFPSPRNRSGVPIGRSILTPTGSDIR